MEHQKSKKKHDSELDFLKFSPPNQQEIQFAPIYPFEFLKLDLWFQS